MCAAAPFGTLGAHIGQSADFVVEASVVERAGKRALYYAIDVTVPWRGVRSPKGAKPSHSHNDTFRGCVRLWNVSHATARREWRGRLTEKPLKSELPATSLTQPITTLVPLKPDGSGDELPARDGIDFWKRGRTLPPVQEAILRTYGVPLVDKLFEQLEEAIAALRARVAAPSEKDEKCAPLVS
jgi:hypothetical protein